MHSLSKAILVAAIATAAVAQDNSGFHPRPASQYAARQTIDNVTIGVEPYQSREKIKEAFGKADLTKLGVLPILVVISNDSDRVLQLANMQVEWITAGRQIIEPISAEDAQRSGPVKRPDLSPTPSPIPGIGRGRRTGGKQAGEIAAREFVAPVVAPRANAHGFFYFRQGSGPDRMAGSKLLVTGIRDAKTGQELMYFEIGLDDHARNK